MKPVSYEDIPYLWGGRDPAVGLDCLSAASHVRESYGEKGINIDGMPQLAAIYEAYPTESMMPGDYPLELTVKLCELRTDPQPFDLVVLGFGRSCIGLLLPDRKVGFMGPTCGCIYSIDRLGGGSVQGIFNPAAVLK